MEVNGVEKWEIEKILNKKKIREIEKYLVWWKGFTVEHDSWIKKDELGNTKSSVRRF